MASRDLAGLLTGISGAQRPNPNQGSDEWRMAFGAQQAQNLGNAVGNVPTMFGGKRNVNPQEAIQIGMGKLDQGNIEDLKTLARMQQMRGDLEGAARTAAKIQAMQEKEAAKTKEEQKNLLIGNVITKEFGGKRPDLTAAAAAGFMSLSDIPLFKEDPEAWAPLYLTTQDKGSVGNVVLVGGKIIYNGNEIQPEDMQKYGYSITKTFVKKPSEGYSTTINTGDKIEAVQYKIDAEAAAAAVVEADGNFSQYLPVIDNMLAVAGNAEFGATTAFFAEANNVVTSLMKQFDMTPTGDVGDTDKSATKFFNANSKLLKQRLLEATKGSISNMENTEITKNTANTTQPKQVALALLNSQRAALTSSADKAAARDVYLRANKNTGGFTEAWRAYVEDFPRTAGYYVSGTGDNARVVNNFEMVEGNFGLFDELYSHQTDSTKRREGVVFVDKNGETDSLKNMKKTYAKAQLEKIMADNNNSSGKPTEAEIANSERKVRTQFGSYLKMQLDSGAIKVVK